MTYAELFSEIKGKFMGADVSNIKEHLAYQFNITGEGEGIFYAEVKDGKLSVEPYDYYNRDVTFTCSAKTLLQIADGKLDPVMAVTLQKLKFEGDIQKALKLKEMLDSRK
uniref:SCP2 sterol-binding domain-containing protein n=1 Tax=Agathobacter sp. TaxID=2021311 RepID=UPI0040567196